METLKLEVCHKEKTAKEYEMLQQNIFLRGSDALPGKLREDFEKMLAAHRNELERNLRKEREGLESEREARLVLERETMKKQLNVERERLNLDLEKERSEMRQASRETEDRVRGEFREEMDRMRAAFDSEKVLLRDTVIKERDEVLMKERQTREVERAREIELLKEQIRTEIMKEKQDKFLEEKEMLRRQVRDGYEKQASDPNKQSKFTSQQQQKNDREDKMKGHNTRERLPGESEEEELNVEAIKSQRGRNFARPRVDESQWKDYPGVEDEIWLANDRMQHTKQWVEKQYRFTGDTHEYIEDSARSEGGMVDGKKIDMDGNEGELVFYIDRHTPQHRGNDIDNRGGNNDKLSRDKGLLKSEANPGKVEVVAPQSQDGVDVYPDDVSEARDKSNNPEYSKVHNVRGLKEENVGLKATVGALQENIELHECFKKEASEEVQRLRTANKDLKMKLEELKHTTGDCEELKAILKNCKGKLKDNELQLKNNEEKIKEYEEICAEYERSLQKCRQRIMVIENDQTMSTVGRGKPGDAQKLSERAVKGPEETKYQGMMDNDDNSVYHGHLRTKTKHEGQMVGNNNLQNC